MDYPVTPDDAAKLERLDDLLSAVGVPGADEAAEALARSLDDAELRASALERLAGRLASVRRWQRAEDVALSLDDWPRWSALHTLVLYLAGSAEWDRAERLTTLLPRPSDRITALLDLASRLLETGPVERALGLVADAETRVPLLRQPDDRARFEGAELDRAGRQESRAGGRRPPGLISRPAGGRQRGGAASAGRRPARSA